MEETLTSMSERFLGPIYRNGQYENPWGTFQHPPFRSTLRFLLWEKNNSSIPSQTALDSTLPIKPINQEELKSPPPRGVRLLWLGHASTLVQFDGISVLTDPVFSDRCGLMSTLGPKRYRRCPVTVDSLPEINAVVISHNHYDHLDSKTVSNLNERFGDRLKWFVPLGIKDWFTQSGCSNVEEMTWWQESTLKAPDGKEVVFACTPCQHWSNRGLMDRCKTLWSSWAIKGPNHSFYFAGDTGYCRVFKDIGERYGPFTVAAIPIGAFLPRDFLHDQHVDPEEAVKIHSEVRAANSVGIHWGTFVLSCEHYLDPQEKLKEAVAEAGLKENAFITLKHGEARVFEEEDTIP